MLTIENLSFDSIILINFVNEKWVHLSMIGLSFGKKVVNRKILYIIVKPLKCHRK